MTDRAAWDAALAAAEQGRPGAVADLIPHGVPDFALERLAWLIRKLHLKVPSEKRRRQAAGRELYARLKKIGRTPESALRSVKAHDAEQFPDAKPLTDLTWRAVFRGQRNKFLEVV